MSKMLHVRKLKPVFSPEEIAVRVRQVAGEIDAVYGQDPLVMVCVLKGAFVFCSDLLRCLRNQNVELEFIRLSSYGNAAASSGHVTFSKDVETDIRDRHVLVVEDIVDSGHTMRFLIDAFSARKPASLRLAALLDNRARREVQVSADFSGFAWEGGFLVGYGLDYAERFRMLPGIYEIFPQ